MIHSQLKGTLYYPFAAIVLLVVLLFVFACNDDTTYYQPPTDGDDVITDGDDENADVEDADSENDGDLDTDTDLGDPNDTTPLNVGDALEDGEVRAGVVGERSQLPASDGQGQVGDFKLYNSKAAFVIAAAGPGRGFNLTGGSLLDAVLLDSNGDTRTEDLLFDAFPVISSNTDVLPYDGNIHMFRADKIELIHNGSGGFPAHVRASGIDWPIQQVDNMLAAPINPKVALTVDYYLDADATYLRMDMTVSIYQQPQDADGDLDMEEAGTETAEIDIDPVDLTLEYVRPGLGVMTDSSLTPFYPGQDTDGIAIFDGGRSFQGYYHPYYAFSKSDFSYAVTSGEAKNLFSMMLLPKPAFILGYQDFAVTEIAPNTQSLVFMISEGPAEQVFADMQAFREESLPNKVVATSSVSGTVDFSDRVDLQAQEVEIIAIETRKIGGSAENPKYHDYIHASSYLDAQGAFELQLPAGDWHLVTVAPWGERSDALDVTVVEEESLQGLEVPAPPRGAVVTISVNEERDEGTFPLGARVDFYHGLLDFGPTGSMPGNIPIERTVFTTETPGEIQVRLPLGGAVNSQYSVVVSCGIHYSVCAEQHTYRAYLGDGEKQGPRNVVLRRIVDPTIEMPPGEAGMYLHTADLNIHSNASLYSDMTKTERVNNLRAEGVEVFVGSDAETIGDYTEALSETGASGGAHPVHWVPGMQITSNNGQYLGVNVLKPQDSPEYTGVWSTAYDQENGTYAGLQPPGEIWQQLKENYGASFVQISRPRGVEDAPAFFDVFGKSEGYDPFEGIDSLQFLVRSQMENWDTMEVINGEEPFAYTYAAIQDWLSLLHQGYYKPITANSELQAASKEDFRHIGSPINLVISDQETLSPNSALDQILRLGQGHNIVTTGPTVTMRLGNALPGDTYTPPGTENSVRLEFNVKVQAPPYVKVNHIYVCINGYPMDSNHMVPGSVSAPVRMNRSFATNVSRTNGHDAYAVVFAFGDAMEDLYPTYPWTPSFAVSNPIFIELDGEPGFTPPPMHTRAETDESFVPYCRSEHLCDYFYNLGLWEDVTAFDVQAHCCAAYPEKSYCQ